MTFFYNSNTGGVVNASPPDPNYFLYEFDLHLGIGWHSYPSQSAMMADITKNHWPQPTTSVPKAIGNSINTIKGNIPSVPGITSVTQFLSQLTNANLWLRIGEFVLGLALIGVGLAKLTGTENVISNTAKKVPVIPV